MTKFISPLARAAFSICVAGLCLFLIFERLAGLDVDLSTATLATIPPLVWAAAIAATWVSFTALGRYDGVAHRHFETGQPVGAARRAGQAAIALSQTIGLGLVTGAFVRWRLLPGLGPVRSARLTAFVALSFIFALGVIAALALLLHPPQLALRFWGILGVVLAIGCVTLAFWKPRFSLGRWQFKLPSLSAIGAILIWTLIDTAAASAALWLLLPADSGLNWIALYPVFLLALGAATLSGAPGGVGPFELTLMALLPPEFTAPLIPALIGYRLIYFALPAMLAMPLLLSRGVHPARGEGHTKLPLGTQAARSEVGVIRQNDGYVLSAGNSRLAVLRTPQALVALFDPVEGQIGASGLRALSTSARLVNRQICLYKCSARQAGRARRVGWRVVRVAQEAVLQPLCFSLEGSSRRQLRRKLRQAEKAGVTTTLGSAPPWRELARIDADWQRRNGTARGTTMGRFAPEYLARQRLYLAWREDALIGFVSFHTTRRQWCLDLVRPAGDAPDGTVQMLITAALADAKALNIPELSLAAIPDLPFGQSYAARTASGLSRFKNAFAPQWQPLYIAAPNWLALTLAAADLARLVHAPDPLAKGDPKTAHIEDEAKEFVTVTVT